MRYDVVVTRPAARSLWTTLTEAAAAAAVEFIYGPLADDPHRVGKPLRAPLDGRWSARRGQYRIQYAIDDLARSVTVYAITHRRDAYHR